MNNCFEEPNCNSLSILPGIFEVTHLEIGGIGLLTIDGIDDKFP